MWEIFLAPPCVNVGKQAAVKRQTRCMRKPTIAVCQHTACQKGETRKYCRVQWNRESVPVQWGRWGRLTMKRCRRGGLAGSVKANNACRLNLLESPYMGTERGKRREVNPVSAIKHWWGKVRQASRWGSWKNPPLYHIWRIPPAYSVVHHEFLAIGRPKSSAVPGRHTRVRQMSPGLDIIIIIKLSSKFHVENPLLTTSLTYNHGELEQLLHAYIIFTYIVREHSINFLSVTHFLSANYI